MTTKKQKKDLGKYPTYGQYGFRATEEEIKHILAEMKTLYDRFNKGRKALGIPPAERIEKNWWPKFRSVAHLWAASVSLKAWTNHVRPYLSVRRHSCAPHWTEQRHFAVIEARKIASQSEISVEVVCEGSASAMQVADAIVI